MDGDVAPVADMATAAIADQHMLVLDEAHCVFDPFAAALGDALASGHVSTLAPCRKRWVRWVASLLAAET